MGILWIFIETKNKILDIYKDNFNNKKFNHALTLDNHSKILVSLTIIL